MCAVGSHLESPRKTKAAANAESTEVPGLNTVCHPRGLLPRPHMGNGAREHGRRQFHFVLLPLPTWSFTPSIDLSVHSNRIRIKITETSHKRIIKFNTESPTAAATSERQIRVLVHCVVVY